MILLFQSESGLDHRDLTSWREKVKVYDFFKRISYGVTFGIVRM